MKAEGEFEGWEARVVIVTSEMIVVGTTGVVATTIVVDGAPVTIEVTAGSVVVVPAEMGILDVMALVVDGTFVTEAEGVVVSPVEDVLIVTAAEDVTATRISTSGFCPRSGSYPTRCWHRRVGSHGWTGRVPFL